ncbi:enoyl-CoA hydratase/isomerase family protein [Nocardia vaccinii]|uniref:enoyl-CoA hydratase/isomerase family protein n=1 Tax=Nocardia vaccinii TaxID=1822 RepID=UPI000834B5BB|nr:enoyl-CoA hydratase/isomerase family protein [Nocardia vaccinii]
MAENGILPEFERIRTRLVGRVLVATLDRPAARNAIDVVLRREFRELLAALTNQRAIGAMVLTGAGDAFCAGGDVGMMTGFIQSDWRDRARNLEHGLLTLRDLLSVQQPVIAAVNGPATGLGATIAMACDLIVMADTATLADTHVNVGIVAGDGGTLLWPAAMSTVQAKQYLLTGQKMTAADAERFGVVNEVVPVADVVDRAVEIARGLAAGPRFAIEWTKHAINMRLIRDLYEQMPLSLALEAATFEQPDLAEGIRSFRERRPAAWPSVAPE